MNYNETTRTEQEVRLLTIPEVCRRLSLGRSNLYATVLGKTLTTVRLGASVRVRSSDLDAYIANLPAKSAKEADQ